MTPVRARRSVALVASVLMVLLLWFWHARNQPPATPPEIATTPTATAPSVLTRVTAKPPPVAPSVARASEAEADVAPIIDEVSVEKREVCAGEENLVTVRAHSRDGQDAFLHYAVSGEAGKNVPIRSWPGDEDVPRYAVAFGRGNQPAIAQIPAFRVKDCGPVPAVLIERTLVPNTWSEYEFNAKLVVFGAAAPGPPPFTPVRYVWDFGDGAFSDSAAPKATHGYENRAQVSSRTQYLVQVKVLGPKGEEVVGRAGFELPNPAFDDLSAAGTVTLFAELNPRFPTLSATGKVEQTVRLHHAWGSTVQLDNVYVIRHFIGEAAESEPVRADPKAQLGTASISPGQGFQTKLALDTRQEPDVLYIDYIIRGHTQEGRPVAGVVAIMRPPPDPTIDTGDAVTDGALMAKIILAEKLLGKQNVTESELAQLESDGKLAGAHLEPSQIAPQRPRADPKYPGSSL